MTALTLLVNTFKLLGLVQIKGKKMEEKKEGKIEESVYEPYMYLIIRLIALKEC